MTLFAIANPDAGFLLNLFLATNLLTTTALGLMTLANWRRSQKREVTLNTGFASAVSFAELGQKVESMRVERRKDISDLHEKIKTVDLRVSRLEGQTEFMRQDVLGVSAKVDRLPSDLLKMIERKS